jgi:hypothetical protein
MVLIGRAKLKHLIRRRRRGQETGRGVLRHPVHAIVQSELLGGSAPDNTRGIPVGMVKVREHVERRDGRLVETAGSPSCRPEGEQSFGGDRTDETRGHEHAIQASDSTPRSHLRLLPTTPPLPLPIMLV